MFRTYEPSRDRLVAVKVFRLDVTPEQAQALADELSRAADAGLFHSSIVEPLAAGVEGTVAYRAEEYVAAESLDVAMRHYAPAALDKALPFITQLAGAIDFARAAGVGHGALHPRDVFVTPDEARATGFGVVEALERVGLRAPVRRPYTAPERIDGAAWSTPADVFSLAAITYELLTARRPAGTGNEIGPLSGDNVDDRAEGLHAVLARAMNDDPERRYHTAMAFAEALQEAAGAETASSAAIAKPAEPVEEPRFTDVAPVAVPAVAGPALGDFDLEPPSVEPDSDDIAIERDEDEAHHDLLIGEPPADEEPALFGDERLEEERLEDERFADLAEEFRETEPETPVREETPEIVALDEEIREAEPETPLPAYIEDHRPVRKVDEPPLFHASVEQERSRPEMLPRAMMLVVGLLVGFLAGWAVFGREGRQTAATSETDVNVGAAAQQPAQPAPQQAAREFSEQAVTPPEGTKPPAPPTVPPEAPSAEPPSRAATPAATRGSISVQSTPAGAAVTVNGEWRGRTPLTLDNLRFGPYTIRVVQNGYAVAREEFRLSADQPSKTMSVQLRRTGAAAKPETRTGETAKPAETARRGAAPAATTGSLYVDSRPRGARVFVDGRAVGVTPLKLADVQPGPHAVRIELADHRTVTARPTVDGGREERVTVSMERIR